MINVILPYNYPSHVITQYSLLRLFNVCNALFNAIFYLSTCSIMILDHVSEKINNMRIKTNYCCGCLSRIQ